MESTVAGMFKKNAPLLREIDGIYLLLEEPFEKKLSEFLRRFEEINKRESKSKIPYSAYKYLPSWNPIKNDPEWKFRQNSLNIVKAILGTRKKLRILEIGGWNGWLTHHLAKLGHKVVSIDYFVDDVNGLSAKKYYEENWVAIQMDIAGLDIFDIQFDLVIQNHNLQFVVDPVSHIETVKQLVGKDGMLLILGLPVYKNGFDKIKKIEAFKKYYRDKYDFDIYLDPLKAFFDKTDSERLTNQGVQLRLYKKLWKSNLLGLLYPQKPLYYYGYWQPD
jgi:SAM-dependent methyltransferase